MMVEIMQAGQGEGRSDLRKGLMASRRVDGIVICRKSAKHKGRSVSLLEIGSFLTNFAQLIISGFEHLASCSDISFLTPVSSLMSLSPCKCFFSLVSHHKLHRTLP